MFTCSNCSIELKPEKVGKLINIPTIYFCEKCGYKEHIFENILNSYKKIIWNNIQDYFYEDINNISPLNNKDIERIYWELCTDYPNRGGKYFRSTLLSLTTQAMGESFEKCIKTAVAIEVSQNWLLIHDDFEDHSVERRGQPALHLKYCPELAINAGDSLHIIMWKILRDNENILGHEKTFMIMDEFFKILCRTTLGQTADIIWARSNHFDLTEEDVFFIFDGKTSYYTIAGPMRLGAIIAENDLNKLEKKIFPLINEFGYNLGRAFQITDDILDLTTEFRGLKKQKCNDIYEGKISLILVHLLHNANPIDRVKILNILQKSREDKTQEEVNYILELMEKYESIKYASKKAEIFALNSIKIFEKMDFFINKEFKDKLLSGIDFIVNRNF